MAGPWAVRDGVGLAHLAAGLRYSRLAALAAQERVGTLAPCSCGQWPHDFWTPCRLLRAITWLERMGYCAQCGERLGRESGVDETLGMWQTHVWCPNGHSDSRTWR